MHSDVCQLFLIQSKCLRTHSHKIKQNLLLINLNVFEHIVTKQKQFCY